MGQLLPVLGNSRCGLKPPDSSVPMPSLWGWERESIPELPPGKNHEHLTLSPGQCGFSRSSDLHLGCLRKMKSVLLVGWKRSSRNTVLVWPFTQVTSGPLSPPL